MYNPQFKTFFAVAETGSFTKAAARLFLTPSAILHQVRALEKEFDAELFVRSAKGVTLTPAGEYLEKHGRELLRLDAEIHRDIKAITRKEETVCIGTSMLEKCRLLYDRWVLFSAEEKGCGIEMVNIDMGQSIPEKADLIESLNSGVAWMREWQFLEICKVPFGCAMVRDHPLAQKERIAFEDLRGMTVHSINDGSCETIAALLARVREHGAKLVVSFGSGMNMFWESAFTRDIQLIPMCFQDILITMTVVPLKEDFLLPYGIFYRRQPSPATRRFLDFIELTYGEGNSSGIVPVLT